jgi:hypothetical protein
MSQATTNQHTESGDLKALPMSVSTSTSTDGQPPYRRHHLGLWVAESMLVETALSVDSLAESVTHGMEPGSRGVCSRGISQL